MKRALYTLLAAALLTGCAATNPMNGPTEPRGVGLIRGSAARAPETAAACDPGGIVDCGRCGARHARGGPCGPGGPGIGAGPTGAITYPYYTLRGPRDFLDRNPPSVGP